MNKKIIFFFVLSCIIIFSSCNKQNKVVNYKNSVFSDNETVSETENIDYVSDFMPSKKEIKYETKYLDITQNNNAVDLRSIVMVLRKIYLLAKIVYMINFIS